MDFMTPLELPSRADVVVIGGGLSGLVCARELQRQGRDVVLLERESHLGGRVASDQEQGFLMDRGFQVLLTGYPAARRWLSFEKLDLRPFPAGAMIHDGRHWSLLGDPLRHPADLLATLRCPVGRWTDKLRVAVLRLALAVHWPLDRQGSTAAFLSRWGFSPDFRRRFFQPFFGGVFLEPELATAAAKFCRLFHLFSTSRATVPAGGMQQIPQQLAQPLQGRAFVATPATDWEGGLVRTERGTIQARQVVLAGAELLERQSGTEVPYHGTVTHYFAAGNWQHGSWLHLGPPDSSFAVVAPMHAYSPPGSTLLAVSIIDGQAGPDVVAGELRELFPELDLRWLRTYSIPRALPREEVSLRRPPPLAERLYGCGDHMLTGSIEGAMESGERAAWSAIGEATYQR
jgi:monoamine oxidase